MIKFLYRSYSSSGYFITRCGEQWKDSIKLRTSSIMQAWISTIDLFYVCINNDLANFILFQRLLDISNDKNKVIHFYFNISVKKKMTNVILVFILLVRVASPHFSSGIEHLKCNWYNISEYGGLIKTNAYVCLSDKSTVTALQDLHFKGSADWIIFLNQTHPTNLYTPPLVFAWEFIPPPSQWKTFLLKSERPTPSHR